MRRRSRIVIAASFAFLGLFYISLHSERLYLPSTNALLKLDNCCETTTSAFSNRKGTVDDCLYGDSVYEDYCVVSPFPENHIAIERVAAVTLCTQGTVEFLHHVSILCNRWSGHISVAVFSHGNEYSDTLALVHALRNCDFCIRHWISWHFFFRKLETPSNLTASRNPRNCSGITKGQTFVKRRSRGTYPINVGRNIARMKTSTPYIFSIDIELYPSPGILSKFERMLLSTKIDKRPQVWVIPVFEIYSKYRAPITKLKLKDMYAKKQAISFHKYRCQSCHMIPNLTQWFDHTPPALSEIDESYEELRVWTTVQRSRRFELQYWEPFFIGTTNDPEFDIRLTWEGKQNKMQMAYEMCIKKYDFHIVENAFLVHAPGVNVYNAKKEKSRFKYQKDNNKWISKIKKDLLMKYGKNNYC